MHRFLAAGCLLLVGAVCPAAATPVEPEALWRVSPAMDEFLEEHVNRDAPESLRLQMLLSAIFGRRGFEVAYESAGTKTPAETFATASGNCLSFTLMFIAMARHVGLDAQFHEVGEVLGWEERGGLLVGNRHIYAELETHGGAFRVDFLPGVERRYRFVRRVGDARVAAHYYNNVGVQELAAGDSAAAVASFERALAMDPSFAPAWTSLGVARRRAGDLEGAESAYLQALTLDAKDDPTLSNLAMLYGALGRQREAASYQRRVEKYRRRNPYYHFRLGMDALGAGDLGEAVARLNRAVRREPDNARFHGELASAYERQGRTRRARRSLERALKYAEDPAYRLLLRARLDEL